MTIATAEPTITEHEAAQVERANASNATPVVFVHGLWVLTSSWDRWVTLLLTQNILMNQPAPGRPHYSTRLPDNWSGYQRGHWVFRRRGGHGD
jgi:hypothetical protein